MLASRGLTADRSNGLTGVLASKLGGAKMADYVTFGTIQALRSGINSYEILMKPPSSLEIFPNLPSFRSSLILADAFPSVDKFLFGKQDWQRWLLFLRPHDDEERTSSIDVTLILAPVRVRVGVDHLRAATSAFEKQQVAILRVSQENNSSPFVLSDIELLQER
jgi:hypothetical protein